MDKEELFEYLTQQIDLLQRKAVELTEQHDEIEKQIKGYRQLIRMYRGVYESEAGVGLQNRLPSEIVEILEAKLAAMDGAGNKKNTEKKKRRKKPK